jgi:hypothetical protein
MDPVSAHVAHVRHLARQPALEPILVKNHGMNAKEARAAARQAVPFLEQALEFLEAAQAANPRVRSVLQYYGYLNLAVACVLVYRPPRWEQHRSHGVEDLTRGVKSLKLGTRIVRTHRGAIGLFHSIISSGPLPSTLRLKDLVVPIHYLGAELEQFGVAPHRLEVSGGITAQEPENRLVSSFTFKVSDAHGNQADIATRFPAKRMGSAMPILRQLYAVGPRERTSRTYVSKQTWTEGNKARAERFHERNGLLLVNFGCQSVGIRGGVSREWRFRPDTPLIPTLTAGLILSFVPASLARYRANLLSTVEDSRLNLLCEVFINEADGFMIPAFRNLLYGEAQYISRADYT